MNSKDGINFIKIFLWLLRDGMLSAFLLTSFGGFDSQLTTSHRDFLLETLHQFDVNRWRRFEALKEIEFLQPNEPLPLTLTIKGDLISDNFRSQLTTICCRAQP